jgi:hypothetical protein
LRVRWSALRQKRRQRRAGNHGTPRYPHESSPLFRSTLFGGRAAGGSEPHRATTKQMARRILATLVPAGLVL